MSEALPADPAVRSTGDSSTDFGEPALFAYGEIVSDTTTTISAASRLDGTQTGVTWVVSPDGAGRSYAVRIAAVRDSGRVADLWIHRLDEHGARMGPQDDVHLHGPAAERFVQLLGNQALQPLRTGTVSASGSPTTAPDLSVLDLDDVASAYRRHPELLRTLIADDVNASDVVATAARRRAVETFRRMLDDDAFFAERRAAAGGPEKAWQQFFEDHPWLLGASLAEQLFVSWDAGRLEQVVAAASVTGPGKRADALLRTAGVVRSLVFVEIKPHTTHLVEERAYRSGCPAITGDLARAVAQSQGSVQLAQETIGVAMRTTDEDGFAVDEVTYTYLPRSFVVAGRLDEFVSADGRHHTARWRSFELFRRNLVEPQVLTFDELLARAEFLAGAVVTS